MSKKQFGRITIFVLTLAAILSTTIIFTTLHSQASRVQQVDDSAPAQLRSRQLAEAIEQRTRQIATKASDPNMILTRATEFDPLAETPLPVRIGVASLEMTTQSGAVAELAVNREAGYFIVQFADKILPEQTKTLRAQGYEIKSYLPNNAYIVKAPRAKQTQLMNNRSRAYRWVGAYGAGLKIHPALAKLAQATTDNTKELSATNVTLAFTTFSGETSVALREVLAQFNVLKDAAVEDRFDNRASGVVEVSSANLPQLLPALANLESMEWIEQTKPMREYNNNGVKIIQSGTTGNDTPLYRRGLTGAGQIIGIADGGLDTDHAQFRLSGDAAAQTLHFPTTTTALVNGALPVNITNPNNKVIAYYLLGTGSLIPMAANPNGGQTLDPNQQAGTRYINCVAYDDNSFHGTHVTSVAAGRDYAADGTGAVPGITTRTNGDGVAPDAKIVFQDHKHPSGQLTGVDRISQALIQQQAYSSGARVHSNSYGPLSISGELDTDDAMWRLRDYTIFFAAGNDGPLINTPSTNTLGAESKSLIAVGACDSPSFSGSIEDVSDYSSHGPTFDGRIKPDIIAPGSVNSATEINPFAGTYTTSRTALDAAINPIAPNDNRGFSGIEGTSFAAPMAAGGGVLVRQYFTDGFYPSGAKVAANGFNPSNALVKAIIVNSGRNMTGKYSANNAPLGESAPLPNSGQGWGRMALDDALFFAGDRRELKVVADIWNGATAADATRPAPNAAIQTGQTHTYQITNVSTVEPLRITLVWSDPKAASSASVYIINNLDLEVTDPAGKVFRGNVNFQNAYSQPAGTANFDNLNTTEAVYIQYPNPGTYTVKVIGANVPGNGQFGVVAQPNNQPIDSNRQGYALLTTGNFTAGAVPVMALNASAVSGGVNADRFVGKNETVTATLTINNPTVVNATNVNVQVAVDAASQVPASLVRINGAAAGQSATVSLGDVLGTTSLTRGLQITLLNDPGIQAGQTITFNVTLTPANGLPSTSQFTITVAQRLLTYRTRFEPTPDPGGQNIIVIPEADWSVRQDNPAPAPNGDLFAGIWQLTTAVKAPNNGSTASLTDPSGVNASYGVSTTLRSGVAQDQSRWWTKKITLPGLTVANDRVSNPTLTQQLKAKLDSYSVDLNADFTGDGADGTTRDIAYLRMRTYTNTANLSDPTDSGFNNATFTNLQLWDSNTASTNGFKRFTSSTFLNASGAFGIDTVTPNNSDVAFRIELDFRRNGVSQTGEGVFFDNLELNFKLDDPTVYTAPLSNVLVTVNGASFAQTQTAPGALVSAFGAGFPNGVTSNQGVTSFPLPTTLNGASVRVNGVLAPLLYVGIGPQFGNNGAFQINYQLPFETPAGTAFVEVLYNGTPITTEFLTVRASAPGLFAFTGDGAGQSAALNQDYQPNGSARPEARGRVLQVYATGTGSLLLNNATRQSATPATGAPAPGDGSTLYVTSYTPTVTIGGIPAAVEYSGLAPGFVGLWQVNVRVPANAPTGSAVPLVISADSRNSNQTTVAIN